MKKPIVLAFFLGFVTFVYAQPRINGLTFPSSVNLFDLYEITFQLGTYSNPYDPTVIDVYAEFTAPDGNVSRVNGFYYEGYRFEKHHNYEKSYAEARKNGWKVRFTPDQEGQWHFTIHAIDKKGAVSLSSYGSASFSFNCKSVRWASGFISKANSRYLRREIVANGQRGNHSFFPIGPNMAWYTCKSYYDYATPYGIYEYERHVDSLAGNANYMRIWLNRPQYLSLYGPEFTQMVEGKPTMYFDNTLNQKDAAELDQIIEYAARNNIAVMPAIFTYDDFKADPSHKDLDKEPADWRVNPFHTVLGLKSPEDFFTDKEAKRITRNLIRYIVARWGYSTNIVAWELWNEVTNMDYDSITINSYSSNLADWHDEMSKLIHENDPFDHLITTSLGRTDHARDLYVPVFDSSDFVQFHKYFNVNKAKSKEQPAYQIFIDRVEVDEKYPSKPFFVGEFGFGRLSAKGYLEKDPYGIDLHNTLWASLFSGAIGPASFWQWAALDKCGIYDIYKPLLVFCKDMPVPSASFTPLTTGEVRKQHKHFVVFPNALGTYYMVNANQDTLYGWCQDTAFAYQSLRRLTDKVISESHFADGGVLDAKGYVYTLNASKKPRPSSKSNAITLPIENQPDGTRYTVRWYNAETGHELVSEATKAVVKNRSLTFDFPSSIRDLRKRCINNTLGDAVFVITCERNSMKNGGTSSSDAANKTKKVRAKKGFNVQ